MDHKEEFEVVTVPDGRSTLSITLACATVREHYNRTTTTTSSVASDPAEVCSTGLRVYEGAQVLAAFLHGYGAGLLPPPAAATTPASVVELGCGCGLVGFTLDAVLRTRAPPAAVSLVFTDASADCLRLVRSSGEMAGRTVQDLDATVSSDATRKAGPAEPGVSLATLRLAWSPAGVEALRAHLPPNGSGSTAAAAAAQLVLGSDLMYYRVDVNALVQTAKGLLCPPTQAVTSTGLIVFAHFMRIADGQRTLAAVAREQQGMHVASVPLTSFLDSATIRFRGWSGIEVVLLSPAAMTSSDQVGTKEDCVLADVRVLCRLLEARAAAWEDAAELSSCATRCQAAACQARALAAVVQPYPSSAGLCGDAGASDGLVDENAFLHLLL